MPITLTSFSDDPLCGGHQWRVNDMDLLALQIARVALGQSRHVKRIIEGWTGSTPLPPQNAVANATKLLTVPAHSDPYHRDGWMFQVMSWIAAHKAAPGAVIRAPQMILADKGFDGLQLEIEESSLKVSAAIIFEDKATDDPRGTIQQKVWPEIQKLESGERENVLLAETVALLERLPNIDPDIAVENIMWNRVRRFRVSITVDSSYQGADGRKRLFKGYESVATGPILRRSGQTFEVEGLRPWMSDLAAKAIAALATIP
jgi:hypothetical protein